MGIETIRPECPECGSDDVVMLTIETRRVSQAVYLIEAHGSLYADECGEVDAETIDTEPEQDGDLTCRDCGHQDEPAEFKPRERCDDCGEPIEVEGDRGLCATCTDERADSEL